MSTTCVGSWHIRPTPAQFEGRGDLKKTWAGPINTDLYGKGLTDLCSNTNDNLTRLSLQMQKLDPCIEYGIKHWHPNSRPQSAHCEKKETLSKSCRWQSVDVMFADNKSLDALSCTEIEEKDTYVDPPVKNTFCYLCTTLEEHKRHMLQHKPKKKYTGRPRISYIAPRPKQKVKLQEEDESAPVKERLYKVEVFTSDQPNAGTNAKVYITIRGSVEYLPKTHLKKNRGCAQLCFVRASKEVFHIKGPYLGNLQVLTIEHDGTKKSHAWHLEKVHITDVKVMKTWVFHCDHWLSIYEKPLYSNRVDIQAEELQHPPTDYAIEVYTGKQKMAGTDSKIFITLYGELGASKKIMLKDPSSDKQLFERNSVDHFSIRMFGIGELKRIRIEHDGKGFAAGWFLDKVIIQDSERPNQRYYFLYGGWIAVDEGDGKLWRQITAKKTLPKELKSGTDTKYMITTKTGDVRYAGTDANVFIQMVGEKGTTKQLTIDNSENNFERGQTDNFEIRAVNVGSLKNIVIGHDNANPGAGWFLESVTVRRYIPKDEAIERLKKMKKRMKKEKLTKDKRRKDTESEEESDSESDNETGRKHRQKDKSRRKNVEKDRSETRDRSMDSKRDKDERKKKKLFSVSSSSDSDSSESSYSETELKNSGIRRPKSAMRRPESASWRGRGGRDLDNRSSYTESGSDSRSVRKRPQSAVGFGRKSPSRRYDRNSEDDDDEVDEDDEFSRSKAEKYTRSSRRPSSSVDRNRRASTSFNSARRVSTSASSLRRQEEQTREGRYRKKDRYDDDDDNLKELKVPLYEECLFTCNKWLAADEDDGLSVRELKVTDKRTFFKEN